METRLLGFVDLVRISVLETHEVSGLIKCNTEY